MIVAEPAMPKLPAYSLAPDEMLERYRALERAHPDLVEILDIGDSAAKVNGDGGHDLWAVVLTDETSKRDKPVVAHLGAVHGSELVAPTLLTEFAEQLVAGFGRDATSTHLLRNREIHLVPMVNPDGVVAMRKLLSGDKDGEYGRPNANGVNINRNFPFGWGGNGADVMPGNGNYRGPAPASEPETRAVVDHFASHRPSVFVDWHNSGGMNLHPWDETTEDGPTSAGQRDVAARISTINGYDAMRSAELYPTSGGTTGWAHGELGAASLTIETGGEDFLTDAGYDTIRRENMPALFELASIADRPVESSRGPASGGPWIWPSEAGTRVVGGWASDAKHGAKDIVAAELVYQATAEPGAGIALKPSDGKFDSPEEQFEVPLGNRRGPKDGLAYIRAKDADGNWGALAAAWMKEPKLPAPVQSPGAVDRG
jgi:predicted deacylase